MTATIKTITSAKTARSNVIRIATAAVLAGMALGATTGTAAAAPSAPLPMFNGTGSSSDNGGVSLDSLLLTAQQASRIVGDRGLAADSTASRLQDSSAKVSPASCLSTYAPGQQAAYDTTQVQGVAMSWSRNSANTTVVTQAVVALPTKKDALDQMSNTADNWKACANRTVNDTTSSGDSRQWTNSQPYVNADRTIVSMMQFTGGGAQTCERAVAAYKNVIIDVMTCGAGATDGQGVALARAIADRASSQSI